MIDWLACALVKTLSGILCRVPPTTCVWLGMRLGRLGFWLQPKRARIGYVNLKAAFGERLTPTQARRMVRQVFGQLGGGLIELLRLPAIDQAYVQRYIEVVGRSSLDEAVKSGRPVMVLSGHFGNWELCPIAAALTGFPVVALARAQDKLPKLYQLLVSYRQSKGCRIVHKGGAAKQLAEALNRREVVGIVADQASRKGIFVDFFGRPALFATGPFEIAHSCGAILIPVFIHRTRGPFHRLVVEPPIEVSNGADAQKAIRKAIEQFTQVLARHVEQDPAQWLWLHKRWKYTPTRRVAILSDGKLGHLKQSLTVLQAIKERCTDVREQLIEVRYRNRFSRVVALLWSWLIPGGAGALRGLRLTLAPACYETLIERPFDVVISCGASTAPINIFLSSLNGAKSAVIMNPRPFPLGRFTLAFVPMHDEVARRSNVIETHGALSTVTTAQIEAAREQLRAHPRCRLPREMQQGRPIIAVLLGGDTPDYQVTTGFTESVLKPVLAICEEHDGLCLVTTSRRTSPDVERLLADRLARHPRCSMLVLASRDQLNGTIEGMLGWATAVVVTGESISMVSEACASGRPVVVVDPPLRRAGIGNVTKPQRYVRLLVHHGYAKCALLPELGHTLRRCLSDRSAGRRLDAYPQVQAAVPQLL